MAFASVGTIGHSGSKGSNHSTYALMTATNAFEPAPNDRVSCMILAILEHRKLISEWGTRRIEGLMRGSMGVIQVA